MSAAAETFTCPITGLLMADPVFTADGFSYEREAIAEWLANGKTISPLSGAELERTDLIPNHALRNAIQQYINDHPEMSKDLYRPKSQKQQTAAAPIAASSQGPIVDAEVVPLGLPVTAGETVVDAVEVGYGLSHNDIDASAQMAVPDWSSFCVPAVVIDVAPSASSPVGQSPQGLRAADPELPVFRVSAAEDGGVALEAKVTSDASLRLLAMQLTAEGSAPVSTLRIIAEDPNLAPGNSMPISSEHDAGFGLLVRALAATNGAVCLRGLRELAINKVEMNNESASASATVTVTLP